MNELSNVNLMALRAVEAVARLGSLQNAAAELGVTPGAVSQQIIKAEAQLERALFLRKPKGMVPTKVGHDMSAQLTVGFEALARGVSQARRSWEDTITISVAPVFAAKWLVRRLGRFAESHPDIRVRIDASVGRVEPQTGEVDACIRVGAGNWSGVTSEEILAQRVFPVCSPTVAANLKDLSDLARVPIIREQANGLFSWDVWLTPNEMSREDLGSGPVYSDASLCLDAAAAGQGVFLALETLAQDAIALDQLVAPFPGRFATGVSYWFVEPAGQQRPPHIQAFRDWLGKELRSTSMT